VFKKVIGLLLSFLNFLLAVAVAGLLTYLFYTNAFYPFDSIDILYYFSKINYFFPQNAFYSIIIFYLCSVMLGSLYIIFYDRIKFGRIVKGIFLSFFVFLIYCFISIAKLGMLRFKEIEVFLIQDFFAILIFYFTIALFYRKDSDSGN